MVYDKIQYLTAIGISVLVANAAAGFGKILKFIRVYIENLIHVYELFDYMYYISLFSEF